MTEDDIDIDVELEELNMPQESCILISNAASNNDPGIRPDDPEEAMTECAELMKAVEDDQVPTEDVPVLINDQLGPKAGEIVRDVFQVRAIEDVDPGELEREE